MVQGIGVRGGGQAEGDGVGVGAVPRADPASIAPESSPGTDGAHGRWATGCWGGARAVATGASGGDGGAGFGGEAQALEDGAHDRGVGEQCDEASGFSAPVAGEHVEEEDALHELGPGVASRVFGGVVVEAAFSAAAERWGGGDSRDDGVAPGGVGGEDAVVGGRAWPDRLICAFARRFMNEPNQGNRPATRGRSVPRSGKPLAFRPDFWKLGPRTALDNQLCRHTVTTFSHQESSQ